LFVHQDDLSLHLPGLRLKNPRTGAVALGNRLAAFAFVLSALAKQLQALKLQVAVIECCEFVTAADNIPGTGAGIGWCLPN